MNKLISTLYNLRPVVIMLLICVVLIDTFVFDSNETVLTIATGSCAVYIILVSFMYNKYID